MCQANPGGHDSVRSRRGTRVGTQQNGADSVLTTDSLRVAAVHRKRHNDMLRLIRTRLDEAGEWGLRNFAQSSYINEQGKEQPMFVMTKDGYRFLVGRMTGRAQRASEFKVQTPEGDRPVLEVALGGTYHRELADDPARSEHFVPVKWLETVPVSHAISELGFFGNQNTVCRPVTPTWATTVERLKQRLTRFDET